MKRLSLLTALVLLLATMAMTAAPAAFAKAETMSFTGTEVFVASTPVVYEVTGGVAHMEFDNVFYNYSSTGDPRIEGWAYTHLIAVATIVDGVPTDANMRGTWRTVALDGTVWEGTFNGTMSMVDLTWDCMIRGKGISGPGTGMLLWCHNIKTEPGPYAAAIVAGKLLAPHGF
jgi:hypothetical protein